MTEHQAEIVYELLRAAGSLGIGDLGGVWRFMPIQLYPYASNYLEERIHNSNLKILQDIEKKVRDLRFGEDSEGAERVSCVRDMCKDFSDFFIMSDPNSSSESKAQILAATASVPRGSSPQLSISLAD